MKKLLYFLIAVFLIVIIGYLFSEKSITANSIYNPEFLEGGFVRWDSQKSEIEVNLKKIDNIQTKISEARLELIFQKGKETIFIPWNEFRGEPLFYNLDNEKGYLVSAVITVFSGLESDTKNLEVINKEPEINIPKENISSSRPRISSGGRSSGGGSSGGSGGGNIPDPKPSVCSNDFGCSSAGNFCDGNLTYSCSEGADGCYDRVNVSECNLGNYCYNGECLPEIICGNNIIENDEICDGEKLEKNCSDFGYDFGTLSCSDDCKSYELAACSFNELSYSVINDCDIIYESGRYKLNGSVLQNNDTTCFEIHADNVELNCFGNTISTNSQENIAAIAALGKNNHIRNCSVKNFSKGSAIYLYDSNFSTIEDSNFKDNDVGIFVHNCRNVSIFRNTFNNSGDGVFLLDVSEEISLKNNILDGGFNGIFFRNSTSEKALVEQNTLKNFIFSIIVNGNNSRINNNEINNSGQSSIYVGGFFARVTNNKIFNSSGFGIEVHKSFNNISGNSILKSNWGIQLVNNNNVTNNEIANSSTGIVLISSNNSKLANNSLTFCNLGISVLGSAEGDNIIDNLLLNGEGYISTGISVVSSKGTNINGNYVSNFTRGIYVSQNNTFVKILNNHVTSSETGFLYGTKPPTNFGVFVDENRFCGNNFDAKTYENSSIDNNYCTSSEGFEGFCDPCM